MRKTLTLNKPLGKTPLEVLDAFRFENPEYEKVKMAYAGRLDPMAEGKLLVLVGDECKERQKYLGLDKEYEFEVLLGVSSDTHDILGITSISKAKRFDLREELEALRSNLKFILKKLQGKQSLPYPVFSSKTVEGKPLFLWALEGKIDEIELPTKEVQVYSLGHTETRHMSAADLHTQIQDRIAQVTPVVSESKQLGQDFRREQVLRTWNNNLENRSPNDEYVILKFTCICSSGTYMRTLASIIGKELGTAGLAWSIKRTKVGVYKKLFAGIGIWTKKY